MAAGRQAVPRRGRMAPAPLLAAYCTRCEPTHHPQGRTCLINKQLRDSCLPAPLRAIFLPYYNIWHSIFIASLFFLDSSRSLASMAHYCGGSVASCPAFSHSLVPLSRHGRVVGVSGPPLMVRCTLALPQHRRLQCLQFCALPALFYLPSPSTAPSLLGLAGIDGGRHSSWLKACVTDDAGNLRALPPTASLALYRATYPYLPPRGTRQLAVPSAVFPVGTSPALCDILLPHGTVRRGDMLRPF